MFHLFERYGVELEYMIVDRSSGAVLPVADQVLAAQAGQVAGPPAPQDPPRRMAWAPSDVEVGDVSWSNELVLHIIELKTTDPATTLEPLPALFAEHVGRVNHLLARINGRLMPGAMHPLMDPARETRLWPHDCGEVYAAFDRVFGCRGHGWANLQSVHLNLPFADDDEFGRLHAAVRLVLPILPALAASSPLVEGQLTGLLDNRLAYYRTNCRRIPSATGAVIPEPVFTPGEYQARILEPLYRDLAPHDPDGTLQDEWANARGAIARFQRNTIEIRLMDMQECPLADLAICAAVASVLTALVAERWSSLAAQQARDVEPLAAILESTIAHGEQAPIADPDYLACFGVTAPRGPRLSRPASGWGTPSRFPPPKEVGHRSSCTAGQLWAHIIERIDLAPQWHAPLDVILRQGPLARRIIRALGPAPDRNRIQAAYARLCDCLAAGHVFQPK